MVATQEELLYSYKNELHNWVSIEEITPNFLWFKISKQYIKTSDIYVCDIYILPNGSNYFRPEMFEDLKNDINWNFLLSRIDSSHGWL